MANNRLYIVDTESGEQFQLASSSGNGNGWVLAMHGALADGRWTSEGAESFCNRLQEFLEFIDIPAAVGNVGEMKPTALKLTTESEEEN